MQIDGKRDEVFFSFPPESSWRKYFSSVTPKTSNPTEVLSQSRSIFHHFSPVDSASVSTSSEQIFVLNSYILGRTHSTCCISFHSRENLHLYLKITIVMVWWKPILLHLKYTSSNFDRIVSYYRVKILECVTNENNQCDVWKTVAVAMFLKWCSSSCCIALQ